MKETILLLCQLLAVIAFITIVLTFFVALLPLPLALFATYVFGVLSGAGVRDEYLKQASN